MSAVLRRLPAVAGLAVLAGTRAQGAGHRAFARLVWRDVQALHARAAPARAGMVTEQMPAGLPDPVRGALCRGGRQAVPRTIRLHQKGRMRPGPGQPWMPLDAEDQYWGVAARLVWLVHCTGPACGRGGPTICTSAARGGCWSKWPRCGRWPTPAARKWTGTG